MKLTNIVFNRVNELIQSPETAKIIKEAYDKFIDKSKNTTPDIKEPKRELQDITQALKRLTRAYGHLIESGVADDTLNEMSDNITVLDT